MKDYRLKNIDHIYECELESDKLTLEVIFLLNHFKNNKSSQFTPGYAII